MSPLASGVLFAFLGAGFFAALRVAPALAVRLRRQVLALGSITVAVGDAGLAVTVGRIGVTGAVQWLAPALFVVGFGLGLVLVPLAATVLAAVRPDRAAAASGVLNTAQQVGGAFGVAVIGIVFYGVLGGHSTGLPVAQAFRDSLDVIVGFALAAAALVQLLPRHHPR